MSEEKMVPSFRVKINGADLPPRAQADLITVTVDEDVAVPGMCALELINWDMRRQRVTWADDDLFSEGNAVEVQMGYVNALKTMMVGDITGLEPEFCADEVPKLTVRGYDRRHRLLRGRKTRSFVQMKDSDIARKIAADLGMRAVVADTGVTLDYVLQHNQTDMEFLQARARRIGYEVLEENKTLHFRPHQAAGGEVLTLTRHTDLIEFYPRLTVLNQVGRVAVKGWNLKDKAAILGQAGLGDEMTTMGGKTSGPAAADRALCKAATARVNWPVSSMAEADQIAVGQFNSMALSYISGEGVCVGRTDLRVGTVIKMEGLGRRFSGRYYVVSTTHTYSPVQGYRTRFAVRRNAT